MTKKIDRTGERFITNEGYEVVVIEYNNCLDILVQFQDKYKAIVHTSINNCKNGQVKNPYHPSVYGVGYFGVGKYKSRENCNKKDNSYYEDWLDLLKRGFDNKYKEKHPTYKDVIVNPELYNFQNFAEWYESHYYNIPNERIHLDKDIKCKGNKQYSPDMCMLVPQSINEIFHKSQKKRIDDDLPETIRRAKKGYRVTFRGKSLGVHESIEECLFLYNKKKKEYIEELVNGYGGLLPNEVREVLLNWTP